MGVINEDSGTVAATFVAELATIIKWVDIDPIEVKQSLVADDAGIIGHLDGFPVAVVPALVGRVWMMTASEPGDDVAHAVDFLIQRLDAPKAPAGEDGGRGGCGCAGEVGCKEKYREQ